MELVIAEKPSVAQSIAAVLGATQRKDGYLEGNEYLVSWCVGHLVELAQPESYEEAWKKWSYESLPIIPQEWQHEVKSDTKAQYQILKKLMHDDRVDAVVCATDAGREGELIFRLTYNMAGCRKPMKRLWISSMEESAIRDGFHNLRPGSDYDNLYHSALCRQEADWLVGINGTRLFTVLYGGKALKVGRVQTPTLAMLVDRESKIMNFKKEAYYMAHIMGNGLDAVSEHISDKTEAERIAGACENGQALVTSVVKEEKWVAPPKLYDLTTLQRDANRLFGFTAKQTLEYTQSLYEKKLVTYPRTDSRYISDDLIPDVKKFIKLISESGKYSDRAKNLLDKGLNLDSRIVDNTKISDHHALLPTLNAAQDISLSENESKVLDIIINRLLMGVDSKYRYTETSYEFWCEDITYDLVFRKAVDMGWKAYCPNAENDNAQSLRYEEGSSFEAELSLKECVSQPKKHFTDTTLISVMENIDNRIDDKSLKAAVSGKGIGTSATRAAIIEDLIAADYISRKGKQVISTQFGREFIASIPDNLKSVERTAEWEQYFDDIQSKGKSPEQLEADVKAFIKTTVIYEKSSGRKPLAHTNPNAPERKALGICPRCGKNIYEGKLNFYCEGGRDCGFSLWKRNNNVTTEITAEKARKLLSGEAVPLKAVSKEGEEYTAS